MGSEEDVNDMQIELDGRIEYHDRKQQRDNGIPLSYLHFSVSIFTTRNLKLLSSTSTTPQTLASASILAQPLRCWAG